MSQVNRSYAIFMLNHTRQLLNNFNLPNGNKNFLVVRTILQTTMGLSTKNKRDSAKYGNLGHFQFPSPSRRFSWNVALVKYTDHFRIVLKPDKWTKKIVLNNDKRYRLITIDIPPRKPRKQVQRYLYTGYGIRCKNVINYSGKYTQQSVENHCE